jgi:D,D-heptose 1,7-bisphosphate phosphatase
MKAVFLDRDGVINELIYHQEAGIIDSPFKVEQFRLLPGVAEAIRLLNQKGFLVLVVSNQPGVAKNHFTVETLRAMDEKMKRELGAQGAHLDGVYYCLHHPDGENAEYRANCPCRKPKPGLLHQAARDFGLDLGQCYMVGDNLTDIKAGRNAGTKTLLIGRMKCELCHLMDQEGVRPDAIVANLLEAVETILRIEGA